MKKHELNFFERKLKLTNIGRLQVIQISLMTNLLPKLLMLEKHTHKVFRPTVFNNKSKGLVHLNAVSVSLQKNQYHSAHKHQSSSQS